MQTSAKVDQLKFFFLISIHSFTFISENLVLHQDSILQLIFSAIPISSPLSNALML